VTGLINVQQPYVVVFRAVLGFRLDLGRAENAPQLFVVDTILEVRVNPRVQGFLALLEGDDGRSAISNTSKLLY
jgi:hypothetical protein